MDCRERLTAVARGGAVDRAPWFAWSPSTSAKTAVDFATKWKPDAVVVESAIDAQQVLQEINDVAVLVEVGNAFGEAMQDGVDLNAEFQKGPVPGDEAFAAYFSGVRSSLMAALESGADGVLYRLFGAEPSLSSPMQFGGRYLEQERELLQAVQDARFNVLYVEGGEDVFLSVVSDLPAHAFGWDEERSRIPANEVKEMRQGALACGLFGTDHRKIWEQWGGVGLVFSGKVQDLRAYDFGEIQRSVQDLKT